MIRAKRYRLEGVRRWILLGVIGLIVIAGLFCLVERESGRRQLAAVRSALQSEGISLTWDGIGKSSSAEEVENGMRLVAAIEPLRDLLSTNPDTENGIEMMKPVTPGWAESGIMRSAPAFRHFADQDRQQSWESFRKEFEASSESFVIAVNFLREPVVLQEFSGGKLLPLIPWLRASGAIKLRDGDLPGAIAEFANIQRIAELLGEPESLVGHSLEMAVWSSGLLDFGWEILQTGKATDSDLVDLNEIVSKGNFVASNLRSIEVELARLSGDYPKFYSYLDDYSFGSSRTRWIRSFLWPILWADGDLAKHLLKWREELQIGQNLLSHRNWQAISKRPVVVTSEWDDWRYPVQSEVGPLATEVTWSRAVRMETSRQLLIGAIALERYRLKHHSYPQSLDALVPEYLNAVPVDWYDGKAIKYRPLEANRFLLYSVNEDGVDDGGDAAPEDANRKTGLHSGRDLVWPQIKRDPNVPR